MRRVSLVMVVGVLGASGGYALIYLFRWEWHRAIIAALFFVAAEVGLGTAVLLRRLGRVEQRLDDLARAPRAVASSQVDPAVLARIRESAPPASKPFAWLDPREQQNLSVFLPFLLGVGALASGLAWVVEQTARHTTAPALERRLARRLAPLALPSGGLLGPEPAFAPPSRVGSTRGLLLPLVAVTLVVGLAVGGLDWLGDAIQTRPDDHRENVSTRIDVELRGSRSTAWPAQAAATLWGTCSHVLHGTVGPAAIRDVGAGRFQITVPTYIGMYAEERVRGCLEDALVDRVQASVTAVESIPAD